METTGAENSTLGSLPREIPLLLIGNDQTLEMRSILDAIRAVRGIKVERIDHMNDLALTTGTPELIVVCQSHPDEYLVADVCRLIGTFPVSRLICAYGVWCEGDGRNRSVWPLAIRVPVSCFAGHLENELAVIAGRWPPLPLTASRTEHFESMYGTSGTARTNPLEATRGGCDRPTVAIDSPDIAWRGMLEQALREADATVTREFQQAACIVWDADPSTASRQAALNRLRAERDPSSIVVGKGFWHAPPHSSGEHVFWKLDSLDRIVRRVLGSASNHRVRQRANTGNIDGDHVV